jgi:tripartite-type tricarboxylate transporter receptor subunit TctC
MTALVVPIIMAHGSAGAMGAPMRNASSIIYRVMNPRSLLSAFVAAALIMLSAFSVSSQGGHTVKIIVPVPPGGAGDIVARQLAEQVGRDEGVAIVVENRPGAGTVIGTEEVARAEPDGNTLLLNAPYLLISPHLQKVNYDPLTGFEPICYLVSSPGVFVVNSASSYRTLGDLVDAARTKPGSVTLASAGPGTAQQIGIEMLKRTASADMTYVPYPGGAPAINDLLGGHVTAVFAEYAPLASHLKAGTLRAIATSTKARIAQLPDVPTVAESGYRDYEVDLWWSLFAPAKTPNEAVTRLARWFTDAMRTPDLRAKLTTEGFSPVGSCGAEFAVLLRKQFDAYGRAIRDANIKAD